MIELVFVGVCFSLPRLYRGHSHFASPSNALPPDSRKHSIGSCDRPVGTENEDQRQEQEHISFHYFVSSTSTWLSNSTRSSFGISRGRFLRTNYGRISLNSVTSHERRSCTITKQDWAEVLATWITISVKLSKQRCLNLSIHSKDNVCVLKKVQRNDVSTIEMNREAANGQQRHPPADDGWDFVFVCFPCSPVERKTIF